MECNNVELREKILTAAKTLFLAKGVDHVSMRKIAEQIGYSPTTIYLYFRNRSELLDHLVQDYYQVMIERSQLILSDPGLSPRHALRSYLILFVQMGLENPDHFRLMLTLFNQRRSLPDAKHSGFRVFGDLLSLVQNCAGNGMKEETTPELQVQSLWALLIGLTTLVTSQPNIGWDVRAHLIEYSIDSHLRGLGI